MSLRLTIHQIMCGIFVLLDDIHDNSPREKSASLFFINPRQQARSEDFQRGGDFEARRAENTRRGHGEKILKN